MSSENKILSFCIPTYNRVSFLQILLVSIIKNIADRQDIEIVISDNASTDSTFEMVNQLANKYDYIVYKKQSENIGFNLNMQAVASLAQGKYIWFFGDDDYLEAGALDYILPILENHQRIMLEINSSLLSPDNSNTSSLPTYRIKEDISFPDGKGLFSFCQTKLQFISSIVVHRKAYIEQFNKIDCKSLRDWHLFYLLSAINDMPCILIAKPFVRCRSSFEEDRAKSRERSETDWVEIFFENNNKVIDFCEQKLSYSRKQIAPVINYQDSQFWKTYAYCKKERMPEEKFVTLKRGLNLIYKKSTVFILLMLYISPPWLIRTMWRSYKILRNNPIR